MERGESPRIGKKGRDRDDTQGSMVYYLTSVVLPKKRKYNPLVINLNCRGVKISVPLFTVINQYDIKSLVRGPFFRDIHRHCRELGDCCILKNYVLWSTRYKGLYEIDEYIKSNCPNIAALESTMLDYKALLRLCYCLVEEWVDGWFVPRDFKGGKNSRWDTTRVKKYNFNPMLGRNMKAG